MEKRKVNEHLSSFFVQPPVIGGLLILALFANYMDLRTLALLLIFLFFLFLISYFWGRTSLSRLKISSGGELFLLFPGEEAIVPYVIRNEKWLPLLWIHFIQNSAERDFLTFPAEMKDGCRRFGVIPWHGSLDFDIHYQAKARGVYPIESARLRSGDGFGLTQMEGEFTFEKKSKIVVFPEIREVNSQALLKLLWTGDGGSQGVLEDISLMQGSRPYEERDSWKTIDWRSFARGGELSAKIYDKVNPQRVLLVLDGENGQSERSPESWEETISLIASLIVDLTGKGISCGLCLPENGVHSAFSLMEELAKEEAAGLLLTALAEFDTESVGRNYDHSILKNSAVWASPVYVFCESADLIACRGLLECFEENQLHFITKSEEGRYLAV